MVGRLVEYWGNEMRIPLAGVENWLERRDQIVLIEDLEMEISWRRVEEVEHEGMSLRVE